MPSVPIRAVGVVLGMVLGALLWAGSSQAKIVTVGATLPMPIEEGIILSCESCVLTNKGFTGPGGESDVSPVDGVILRWHLYKAGSTTPGYLGTFRLRVLSSQGRDYVGAGRSVPVAPAGGFEALETFPTDLPIRAGQLIGLEPEDMGSKLFFGMASTGEPVLLEPAIADGQAASPPSWWHESGWGREAVWPFNAEILPVPVIGGVDSIQGPSSGGNQVAIRGENFAEVTGVSFGSTEASYVVDSETQLTVTVPPGSAASTVPVSVVTLAGRAEGPARYAYEPLPSAKENPQMGGPSPGCRVPRLKGRSLNAARRVLSRDRCRLGRVRMSRDATSHSGHVKKQSPPPGATLPSGGKVEVTLGLTG